MNRRQAIVAITAGSILAMPAVSGADPVPDGTAKELAKFDGNWEPGSSINDGKVADLGEKKRTVLVFDGGRMAAVERGRPEGFGTIKVNAGEEPAQIDWKYGDSPAKTGTSKGIYKFDGDTLTICVGGLDPETGRSKTRPTQFKSQEGTGTILLVYKRVKRGIRLQDFRFPADLNEPPSK